MFNPDGTGAGAYLFPLARCTIACAPYEVSAALKQVLETYLRDIGGL